MLGKEWEAQSDPALSALLFYGDLGLRQGHISAAPSSTVTVGFVRMLPYEAGPSSAPAFGATAVSRITVDKAITGAVRGPSLLAPGKSLIVIKDRLPALGGDVFCVSAGAQGPCQLLDKDLVPDIFHHMVFGMPDVAILRRQAGPKYTSALVSRVLTVLTFFLKEIKQ